MTNDWFYEKSIDRARREFNHWRERAEQDSKYQWLASVWGEHVEYLENLIENYEDRKDVCGNDSLRVKD